jgi:hypothetical protein
MRAGGKAHTGDQLKGGDKERECKDKENKENHPASICRAKPHRTDFLLEILHTVFSL